MFVIIRYQQRKMTDTTLIYHQLDLSDSYLVNVHLLLKSYGQMFQMLNHTEHVYCLQQPFMRYT